MPVLKLPRLKSNLAIVNGQGRPTDFFLRLFNIDFAGRLEKAINDQDALLQQILAAQAAAAAAQASADAALAAAQNAATDAAAERTPFTSTISTTSFVSLFSVSYPGRMANGIWNFSIFEVAGHGEGVSTGDIEIRVIESGAGSPLATASVAVPNGPPDQPLTVDFSPLGPYDQTVPAGNLQLVVQARRIVAGNNTNINGVFSSSYTPRPA